MLTNKATKTDDNLVEPIIHNKKKVNQIKKYEIWWTSNFYSSSRFRLELDPIRNLRSSLVRRVDANEWAFDGFRIKYRYQGRADDQTLKTLAKALKSTKRIQKLDIDFTE